MKTGTLRRWANRARRERERYVRSMTQGEVTDVQLSTHPGRMSARFYEFQRDQMLQRPDTPVRLICAFPETDEHAFPRQPADDDQSCESAVKHGFRMQGIVVETTVLRSRRRGGRRTVTFFVRLSKTIPARF